MGARRAAAKLEGVAQHEQQLDVFYMRAAAATQTRTKQSSEGEVKLARVTASPKTLAFADLFGDPNGDQARPGP
jgi:hypothetical protein